MDFRWSDTQTALYDRALEFARQRLQPAVAGKDPDLFPREAWNLCAEFGLVGLSAPASAGGMGLDALTTARVFEAFGRGTRDLGLLFGAAAHLFACVMPIAEYGSEGLKASLLPNLSTGRWIGANAITEAGAGSDVFALSTTAKRDGAHFILDGEKSYVTNGPVADVFLVYATSNKAYGYLGVSAFLVRRDTPGLRIGEPFKKIGLGSASIGSLYLEGCRVHEDQLLSGEGQGALVFSASMVWERACLFALYVGAMERQLEEAVAFARERRQGKQAIAKYQAISHRIADMKLRLEAARLLLYKACWTLDQRMDPTMEVALSKIAVSEAAVESAIDLVRIHGGAGVIQEVGVERGVRDALPGVIFSGTSEIQRNLIATRLGL